MRSSLLNKISISVVISLIISFFSPFNTAHAATGDSDTYLNLEGNTTSSGAYVLAAYNSVFHIDNAISAEAWVRPTYTSGNPCQSNLCTIVTKDYEWALSIYGGTYQYAIYGGSIWSWVNTTIPAHLNAWQHVALTRDTNSTTVNFYLNGKLVFTGSSNGAGASVISNQGAYNFTVGAWSDNSTVGVNAPIYYRFIGDIDELKIWNVARSASDVLNDMNNYGPTNNSNLKLYYDFNDASGSTVDNKASGATSTSQLTLKNSPSYTRVDSTTVVSGNMITYFRRPYLSANGYKLPVGTRSLSALVIGGGGGGGNNVGNGGSGGGGYLISNLGVTSSTQLSFTIGMAGAGGKYTTAGTLVYDGTYRMDGQNGETTTLTMNGTSFLGGGGGGGQTIWSGNYCGSGSEDLTMTSVAGIGIGSGGSSYTGGLGGTRSATQATANGKSGFTSNITGTSTYYSGGGGSGSWSGYLQGTGANSIGGDGNGSDGVDGTGSGGGGNAAGCANGGYGSNGTVILSFAAYSGEISVPATAIYRTASSIVATLTATGLVTFYEKGKVIASCKNIPTVTSTTITATCTWKPTAHGVTTVSAKFIATGGSAYPASIPATSLVVAKRTNVR